LSKPAGEAGDFDLKLFEQTSSANQAVVCAGVVLTGRISMSLTGTPLWANAQAASTPANPAPTTVTTRLFWCQAWRLG
jgi:hypothetical protein